MTFLVLNFYKIRHNGVFPSIKTFYIFTLYHLNFFHFCTSVSNLHSSSGWWGCAAWCSLQITVPLSLDVIWMDGFQSGRHKAASKRMKLHTITEREEDRGMERENEESCSRSTPQKRREKVAWSMSESDGVVKWGEICGLGVSDEGKIKGIQRRSSFSIFPCRVFE